MTIRVQKKMLSIGTFGVKFVKWVEREREEELPLGACSFDPEVCCGAMRKSIALSSANIPNTQRVFMAALIDVCSRALNSSIISASHLGKLSRTQFRVKVLKTFEPNVCTYNVMSMVKVRKPCLRAYTKIERVRKANCPYSEEWCVDYKPRTIYYTGYSHKLEPRYVTVHRCCEGCFPIDEHGCPHKECLTELTEVCEDTGIQYCSCDERLPEPPHCPFPGQDPCSQDNGGCDHYCHAHQGAVNCTCAPGFVLQKDGRSCREENPCSKDNGGCSHYCHYENRTLSCQCAEGFQLAHDRRTCKEKNPCDDGNGGCQHSCSYEQGQLRCYCASGFDLRPDGKTCRERNPCDEDNGGCEHYCSYKNKKVHCRCAPGYSLLPDKRSCTEINPCKNENGGCEHKCNFVDKKLSCDCEPDFVLQPDGRSCKEINPCETKNGGCQQKCLYVDKRVTCECEADFTLQPDGRSCKENNPCESGNGGCQQKCFFKDRRVTCGCKAGFELLPDGRNCRVSAKLLLQERCSITKLDGIE
ncbi:multiple epidermal growth factor-like domains protein 6 [Trichonephila inaurata madagascariensis]|uniref:Multiple epidermal growth factor-like domains protein 6 n=1 Tax=Trichonephila inaurata madagascariensis TaxID=2747483 RepID=A0A8X6YC15_9ARAC|nr:multiple epidermal growth factor-like domains protein 6 [Trichonephila inaurata madagascariensis]